MRRLALVALVACSHPAEPAPSPTRVAPPAPVGAEPAEPAAAPAETAVIEHEGRCYRENAREVQCPATIVAPDPAVIEHGSQSIHFDWVSFRCKTGDELEPCPDALLPRLAPGVEPTRQNGSDCALGDVRVACP